MKTAKAPGPCCRCGGTIVPGEAWVMVVLEGGGGFPAHIGPCPRNKFRQIRDLWRKAYG